MLPNCFDIHKCFPLIRSKYLCSPLAPTTSTWIHIAVKSFQVSNSAVLSGLSNLLKLQGDLNFLCTIIVYSVLNNSCENSWDTTNPFVQFLCRFRKASPNQVMLSLCLKDYIHNFSISNRAYSWVDKNEQSTIDWCSVKLTEGQAFPFLNKIVTIKKK